MLDWKRTLLVVAICQSAGGCGSHDHDHGEAVDHSHADRVEVVQDGSAQVDGAVQPTAVHGR